MITNTNDSLMCILAHNGHRGNKAVSSSRGDQHMSSSSRRATEMEGQSTAVANSRHTNQPKKKIELQNTVCPPIVCTPTVCVPTVHAPTVHASIVHTPTVHAPSVCESNKSREVHYDIK